MTMTASRKKKKKTIPLSLYLYSMQINYREINNKLRPQMYKQEKVDKNKQN